MTLRKNDPEVISNLYKAACLAELGALKPGNVHIFADGHDMTVSDFIISSEKTAEFLVDQSINIGERIFLSVHATKESVGKNTNLGVLLLCAPIADAAMSKGIHQTFEKRLQNTLSKLNVADAEWTSKAVILAKPAGLGHVEIGDVNDSTRHTLLELMQFSEKKDRIAWNYVNNFQDMLFFGIDTYRNALAKWNNPTWAITYLYIKFLSAEPDTHLLRKFDKSVSHKVQQDAIRFGLMMDNVKNPKKLFKDLLNWDASLKKQGINPGTSADLVVATLFLSYLIE